MLGEIIIESLVETLKITIIILILMVIIEFIEIKFNHKLREIFSKKNHLQILFSSIFGILPGCVGTFTIDSFYMSGIVGFGAINAVMIATSGDEAIVLLAMAFKPDSGIHINTVLILFGILFLLGIIGGYCALLYKKLFKIKLCKKCIIIHREDQKKLNTNHFFKEHVLNHIIKKHVTKLSIWLFFSIFFIELLNNSFNLEHLITNNKVIILMLAAIVGILPISGPNLLFLTLFSQGLIPFSILLTNSIVQDGHGSLPLLSFSVQDTIKIKLFNIIYGLTVGYIILLLGF